VKALLLLLLLGLQDAGQRARDFYDRIQFDAPSPDSDEGRKVAEILTKKEHWIGAYRSLEQRLGTMPERLVVKVDFTLEGEDAGWGASNGSEGKVRFNLKQLAERQRRMDETEAKRKEALARGQRVLYKVPPMKMDRLIYHELTHVFQRGCQAPAWWIEGMAQMMSDDPNNLAAYANGGKTVKSIDEEVLDRNDTYARGHVFWKWLDSRGAAKRAAELVVLEGRPWKTALEEATGYPWAILVITEREWSSKEVERMVVKDPKGR
jgi:hypothetical protein